MDKTNDIKQTKSLKDVLTPEEYKRVLERNINSIIGSLKHEGYVDDGFIREQLTKLYNGEITEKEYDLAVNKKLGLKQNNITYEKIIKLIDDYVKELK